MADNTTHNGYGTYTDLNGQNYKTPDGKPPTVPQTVTVYNGYGNPSTGTWSGGIVTPHSKTN